MNAHGMCRIVVIAGLALPSPSVWAALEVERSADVSREVTQQVERLVSETASRDPELAQEIKLQGQECLRDLSDGKLDNPQFTKEIETSRDVQRELTERVLTREAAKVSPEAAERIRAAFEAWQGGGGTGGGRGEFAGPSQMGLEQARGQFEQAYQEAVTRGDTKGAETMKATFESMERGEAVRPTPEMMEKMHQEMERFVSERPEMADYARAEWDRMMEHGMGHEGAGSTEDHEQARREGFERWASESGRSPEEIARMRETMEQGLEHVGQAATREEMERGFANGAHDMEHLREMGEAGRAEAREAFERWAESPEARNIDKDTMEHYREMAEHAVERPERETDYTARLDTRVEMVQPAPDAETFVRMDPEGGVFRHSDQTCHNHGTNVPDNC